MVARIVQNEQKVHKEESLIKEQQVRFAFIVMVPVQVCC